MTPRNSLEPFAESGKLGARLLQSMKISVVGLGYLGATHAIAMASLGHDVIGIESDQPRLGSLQAGLLPFFEPGLDDAFREVLRNGSLSFQSKFDASVSDSELHFLCVGTPQLESGKADISQLESACKALAPHLKPESIVVGKSTVPVGTAAKLRDQMSAITGFPVRLSWNPEFLREGHALDDSLNPDRIVVGASEPESFARLHHFYEQLTQQGIPFLEMSLESAELVKVAANSFLATKISFINAVAEIAELTGGDVVQVENALGLDQRIGGRFLKSGLGFGGGCLPKDIRSFTSQAEDLGLSHAVSFLKQVDAINLRRRQKVLEIVEGRPRHGPRLRVLVMGLSFKPNSDDLRDSPSLDVAMKLKARGHEVYVNDPVANDGIEKLVTGLNVVEDLSKALEKCDVAVLGTDWEEYVRVEPPVRLGQSHRPSVVDARNCLDETKWTSAGWTFLRLGIGREI